MKAFLSYSRKNEAFVEKLYGMLTRDGVECWFDKKSIAWGENWVIVLEKGLEQCDAMLVCLSPDYCRSEWAGIERTSYLLEDPNGLERKIRPLLVELCDNLIPPFLKPRQCIDVSTPEKFNKEYPRICRELKGTPPIESENCLTRDALPPVRPLLGNHRMPYRSLGKGFVGRVKNLWDVDKILREKQTAVIEGVGVVVGMGGIGKTQLAVEYVHRFGMNYTGGVFWVDSDRGVSTLIAQVLESAEIEMDQTLPEKAQLGQLWEKLARFTPVLIVLDNFPENKPLQPWLPPSGSFHVLVTTRRRDLKQYTSVPLDTMTPDEGLELLNTGERDFGQEATELVEILGGLPLALELARNFLNIRSELTIEGLLEEIRRVGEMKALDVFAKKYGDELPSGHIKEVAATIQLSWSLASDEAKSVLQAMAYLAPAPVPRRLLRKILKISSENLIEDPLDEAISELEQKLSLADLDDEHDPSLHRLIAAFVKYAGKEEAIPLGDVAKAVQNEMALASDEKNSLSYREPTKTTPHAEHLVTYGKIEPESATQLAGFIGWHFKILGYYRSSEKWLRKALDLSEKHFELGAVGIAIRQSDLGQVLRDLGEFKEARELSRMALESYQKNFEPGHPTIAARQSCLALVLRDLGELEEARDLLRMALKSYQKNFWPGHTSIAISQVNLAAVLQDFGEFEEAVNLLRIATDTYQRNLKAGHPDIAKVQSNLAHVLWDSGKPEEAKNLLRMSLKSAQESFEPGHPTIAKTLSNLALVLKDLREFEEARDLLRLALKSDQNNFEPGHQTIANRKFYLAQVLQDMGEREEARNLMSQAYESFFNKFGPDHPRTKMFKNHLSGFVKDAVKNKPKRKKVGRNEPCPCGSGKKYKKCCLD